jgi:arsenical resistance protein ArsH
MTLQHSRTRSGVKSVSGVAKSHGDLNNTDAARSSERPLIDPAFAFRSLAIPSSADSDELRQRYRPFLLQPSVATEDWISRLELATVTKMAYEDLEKTGERIRVLVLYGSLRKRYVNQRTYLLNDILAISDIFKLDHTRNF